jgi:CDP-glucose 4,6-dehydratase
LVRLSYDEPLSTFATNVMGTANVLEACRRVPVLRAIVVVTTDKVYENREWPWPYRESDALGGKDPYSASKAAAELAVLAWRRGFFAQAGIPLVTARGGNVIGGGDWATDRLVPDIFRSLADGMPLSIRSPKSVRPWQHVLDPLYGYLLLAVKLLDKPKEFSSSWNFGPLPTDKNTVGEVAAKIIKVFGVGKIDTDTKSIPLHEAGLLLLDSTKAEKYLGWKQLLHFDDAVDRTANWYKRFSSSSHASILCEDDIQEYMKRISTND